MTQEVINAESYLCDKFDAIISGSFFEKIRTEFEYSMGNLEFKNQVIQVIVKKLKTITDIDIDKISGENTNEFNVRKIRFLQLLSAYLGLDRM